MPINNTAKRPKAPIPEGGDGRFVRFGSKTTMPSEMPPLELAAQNIIDPGIVRLGAANITSVR